MTSNDGAPAIFSTLYTSRDSSAEIARQLAWESPTVSPGSREADTATPVGRHAVPYPDVMSPAQIAARFTMLDHQYDLRRKQSPFADYQPRHEGREWAVKHGEDCAWGPGRVVLARDSRSLATETAAEIRDKGGLCVPSVVSRVLPDGEWEVAL